MIKPEQMLLEDEIPAAYVYYSCLVLFVVPRGRTQNNLSKTGVFSIILHTLNIVTKKDDCDLRMSQQNAAHLTPDQRSNQKR